MIIKFACPNFYLGSYYLLLEEDLTIEFNMLYYELGLSQILLKY